VQQLHGCHAIRIFFATIDFLLKLFGWLERTRRCWHMAGFFLATPGDLAGLHESAVRLFMFGTPSPTL